MKWIRFNPRKINWGIFLFLSLFSLALFITSGVGIFILLYGSFKPDFSIYFLLFSIFNSLLFVSSIFITTGLWYTHFDKNLTKIHKCCMRISLVLSIIYILIFLVNNLIKLF